MKIEKVNDNQIRCTLTREDLADRQLRMSELAYGTEKAKSLFREMMQQAAYECGFEAEDTPLMIEAIPLSSDSIILIITKVEYPEELDTRFSQFSQGNKDEEDIYPSDSTTYQDAEKGSESVGADDILDLFKKIQAERINTDDITIEEDKFIPLEKAIQKKETPSEDTSLDNSIPNHTSKKKSVPVVVDITKLFVFGKLDEVNRLAHILKGFYNGCNVLYKNITDRKYYLVISKSNHTPEEFNKVCNILSEYAQQGKYSSSIQAFFDEHYETILKKDALQILGNL